MKNISKEELEKKTQEFKNKDKLTDDDLKELKRNNFDFAGLKLFNFYRKMKAYVCCRKCTNIVRKSSNLKGFLKTPVEEALEYCNKNLCKVCLKRTEKIRKEFN